MHREVSGVYFSFYNKSSHPTSKRPTGASDPKSNRPQPEQDGIDFVAQDKIWREYLHGQRQLVKDWENNWGFLTKYDAKGAVKAEKELPDKLNMFSNDVPNTSSGSYGANIDTPLGQKMQNLEFKFYANLRRKRTEDLICY